MLQLKLLEAVIAGDSEAYDVAAQLLAEIKIVNLTDKQSEVLGRVAREVEL